jgi:hypothetical protein
MTDARPIIIDEDAAIDSAFFGSHAGRTCYARAHRSGWGSGRAPGRCSARAAGDAGVWGRV